MAEWEFQHGAVLSDFIGYLNDASDDFILKGGTALHLCYGLDRFSEGVDLDGLKHNLVDIVDAFCKEYDYEYRVSKYTPTVERCFINYGNDGHPLKVEASYRSREIPVRLCRL